MVVQHSSASFEWYTPTEIIEAARVVLGVIDLDPCSSAQAQETVRAINYVALPDDGLAYAWCGRVWCNPPGGVGAKRKSRAAAWWRKFGEEWLAGRMSAGLFTGFTLELLRLGQDSSLSPLDSRLAICVPRHRLRFTNGSTGKPGKSPGHANVIIYAGQERDRFRRVFGAFGDCK